MNDNEITVERLRNAGLLDPAAAKKTIAQISKTLGAADLHVLLPALLDELSLAADPDMALNNLERFISSVEDVTRFPSICRSSQPMLRRLITVFGASRFLSAFAIANAEEGLSFFSDPDALKQSSQERELTDRFSRLMSGSDDERSLFRALRVFRKWEMLRIGLRDLMGEADLPDVVKELSNLASFCMQNAYLRLNDELRRTHGRPCTSDLEGATAYAEFAVIAMGKLGGNELNFSSDVDLMYVYTADGETEGVMQLDGSITGRISNHQYFVKLAEKLNAAIGSKTDDGFAFRVDLRLRPEGQRGPLAQSLSGYELYYESWGQTWERSALIKARPVAGDADLGRQFLDRISPFVFRKYLDYAAITEIRDMKQKINKDVGQKGGMHRDVKLGYGGIREIEFVVQALQLVHGGRDRSLQEKNALKAMHVLAQRGLISHQEHASLSRAYVFLRMVEHRIQIVDDLQTQTMPIDERELRRLARSMGYLERENEANSLLRDYAEHTKKVRSIFDNLFAFTGEEMPHADIPDEYSRLLDPETAELDAVAVLERRGFRDPGKAYRNLRLLREGPALIHQTPRSRRVFHEMFPAALHEIALSPDPDMALNHFESFLAANGSWEAFQSLVTLDPAAVKILISLFANSEYLSRLIIARPSIIQNLTETRRPESLGTRARFAKGLQDALQRAASLPEKLDALRIFKHTEEIRIGMSDLLSDASLSTVSRDLSKLAEACIESALALAASEVGRQYNQNDPLRGLAVIGAGKLGGRELIYGSDLDIFFVYSEGTAGNSSLTAFEYFSKVAEKTISYISSLTREGFVFRVDMRLRLTGSKGPLVQSIEACRHYYAEKAETWERQSLLRSRCVAGDRTIGARFVSSVKDVIFKPQDRSSLASDVLSMRERMRGERGSETDNHYNIKQGLGGSVDIEFAVQYLQLLHGDRIAGIRVPGVGNALRALKRCGLLDREFYLQLMRAYSFLRRLESRMRIVSNQAGSELSKDPVKLEQLARRMGYRDVQAAGETLLLDYLEITRQVRDAFMHIVSLD